MIRRPYCTVGKLSQAIVGIELFQNQEFGSFNCNGQQVRLARKRAHNTMVANRIMGTIWVLVGILLVVPGIILALSIHLGAADTVNNLVKNLPSGIGQLYHYPDLGALPANMDIFLVVLGVLLLFYGGAVLGRVSW